MESTTPVKTVIRPKTENYVRDRSGSGKRTQRIDDLTARTLAGKTLEEIKQGANVLAINHPKWSHLNAGQQRMLIGNAIRHKLNSEKEAFTEADLASVFGAPADPYDADAVAAAKAAREAEAAEKKAAKDEAKAARAAAKAAKAA